MPNRSTNLRPPVDTLPEPLRAAEQPSFTHDSVVRRLPDIARRTLAENDFSPEVVAGIQTLIAEIPSGTVRPVVIPLAPEDEQWAGYIQPYKGWNWLEIPWFFAEEYFYIRILEATGYFHPGPGRLVDPYRHQKQMGLESTRASIHELAEVVDFARLQAGLGGAPRDSLARLLLVDLWGNQNDLSMWPVHKDGAARDNGQTENQSAREHILADDSPAVLDYLEGLPDGQANFDILLDNAGYELVTDLALADFLISTGRAASVTLHAKSYPVFVSDALEKDVHATLDFMIMDKHGPTHAMAIRLRSGLVRGQLRLAHHAFWTSPLAGWEMPADLAETIQPSTLLISKGDANYRRLLGDRHWPLDLPFGDVVGYLDCPVLALRTLKSEIAVGLNRNHLPAKDPNWMINGRWGLVQFAQNHPYPV